MPDQDTSQQGLTLTDDETANAALLFGSPDEGSTPDSDVAPVDGSVSDDAPTDKAPTDADGEMGDDDAVDETANATEGEKSTDGDTEESSDDVDPDVLAEADALSAAILGNGEVEPAGDPVWMKRAGDMTRKYNEEHMAHQESKAKIAEALATVGLELVETSKGLQTARVDGYKDPRVTDFDANEAWANLSEAEKAAFKTVDSEGIESSGREAFKLAYENGVKHAVDKVPHAQASVQDRILPQQECDRVYTEFASKKLPGGKLMFPDCDSPEIQLGLQRAADSPDPVMLSLREAAAKDPVMYEAVLELAYNRYFRSTYERKAFIAAAKRRKTEQIKKDKQTASVPGTGGNATGKQGSTSAEDKALAAIASWKGGGVSPDGAPYMQ